MSENESTALPFAEPEEVGTEVTESEEGADVPAMVYPVPARNPAHHDLMSLPFGEIAARLFGLTATHIGNALDQQAEGGVGAEGNRIGEVLIAQEALTLPQVLEGLAAQMDVPWTETLQPEFIAADVINEVPISFAKQNAFCPLGRTDDGVVIVAVADPLDAATHDALRALYRAELELVVSTPKAIAAAINSAYDRALSQQDAADIFDDGEEINVVDDIEDLLDFEGDDEAPIIQFVNWLMREATKERASDIHIEPFEREMLVRFRVDGVLREVSKPPKRQQNAITSRVKIMAGLNIAEKRLPQDGRIRLKVAGKDIDVRVSTVPTTYGERVVMRLLDRSSVLRPLDTIGFSPRNLSIMTNLISKSHGIILVTGPTGSGKTSTLYACLSKINRPDLNILTIEDPVEYQLNGVGQVQVNPKIELSFASGLRSFLRQDPDVIMVGEIRDRETAEIAIQASLTGHLVLSTVHTNDSAGAVTRLVDMGVEPFLVASSLIGVLAQRLVRTICPDCKVEYAPPAQECLDIGLDPGEVKTLTKGEGCPSCLNTGYRGRTGIYECMLLDDEIRQLILANADAATIKNKARAKGLVSLREDGADKVLRGITTVAEVARVTQEDSMSLEAFS